MLMYFSSLTLMWSASQTTSSEHSAVQMAPQTITKNLLNLTVGYICRKENSWDGSHQPHQDSTTVRKLCKPRLIREDNSIPKLLEACLSSLTPLLSVLKVKRAKKWLPCSSSTAIPKGMEIVDNSSWVLLNYFGHISCSCWTILFHRSLDSTESPLIWLWMT